MKLYYEYLGPSILAGFDTYKYSSKDTSPLSNYVMHPFWNQVVKLCPRWVAPNLLTFVGFLCCVGHFGLLALYDYDFRSATAPPGVSGLPDVAEGVAVPSWVWVGVAVLLFLSHTLDGIDGKQARRTGSSNPLGELFDHGLDSWATIFITGALYSMFGRNDDGLSVSLFRMFCVFWNIYLCFLISHWEKYNTGVLYLPWGYDFSMTGTFIMYLATAAAGLGLWKLPLPGGMTSAQILEPACYLANVGLTLPIAIYNIRQGYKEGTGKNRTLLEAMRPLVSTLIAMVLCFIWVLNSPNNVLEMDPRCLFLLTGTVFANICCKLIIAQMSNTRSELFSVILIPLALTVALVLVLPGITASRELAILYALTGFVILAHIHYGSSVVAEMCDHLKVRPFHIKHSQAREKASSVAEDRVRLINSEESLV